MKRYILSHTKQIPKTKKELKQERVAVINKYLEGNLLRFLRKHYKQYNYGLVFSRYIKKWRKEEPKLVKLLEKCLKNRNGEIWPKHVSDVVNIMRTLEKHYGHDLDINTCKIAIMIDDLFEIDIYEYCQEHRQRLIAKGNYILRLISKRDALKEQKAQGFIKANNWDDHDWRYAHLTSNIDPRLVYPYNFSHDILYKTGTKNIIYQVGMRLAGVPGYTRINIPKN